MTRFYFIFIASFVLFLLTGCAVSNKEVPSPLKELNLMDQILGSGDPSRCSELPDEASQSFCRNQFPGQFNPADLSEGTEEALDFETRKFL